MRDGASSGDARSRHLMGIEDLVEPIVWDGIARKERARTRYADTVELCAHVLVSFTSGLTMLPYWPC